EAGGGGKIRVVEKTQLIEKTRRTKSSRIRKCAQGMIDVVSPRAHIERDVPPVIGPRRKRKPRLTHDLHPHVQCRTALFPPLQSQIWPAFWRVGVCNSTRVLHNPTPIPHSTCEGIGQFCDCPAKAP